MAIALFVAPFLMLWLFDRVLGIEEPEGEPRATATRPPRPRPPRRPSPATFREARRALRGARGRRTGWRTRRSWRRGWRTSRTWWRAWKVGWRRWSGPGPQARRSAAQAAQAALDRSAAPARESSGTFDAGQATRVLSLGGRTLLVLAGAFVLRALTDCANGMG